MKRHQGHRRIYRKSPKRGKSAGITLVELMVSITILGVVLAAVAAMMTGDLRLRRTSMVSNTGNQLASGYLEAVKRLWSVPDNYVAPVGERHGTLPAAPADPRFEAFTMVVDITCLNTDGMAVLCANVRDPDLRQVKVSVEDQGSNTVAALVTQIGRPFDPGRSR